MTTDFDVGVLLGNLSEDAAGYVSPHAECPDRNSPGDGLAQCHDVRRQSPGCRAAPWPGGEGVCLIDDEEGPRLVAEGP